MKHTLSAVKWLLSVALVVSLASCSRAKDSELAPEVAKQVMEAFQSEDFDRVVELTQGIVGDSQWRQVRATAFQRRGEKRFFDGKIKEAIADFDEVVALYPEQDPHHWQRGIGYYYAGEYEKGKAQFERHQTVNPQDVENAVWHFLCAVRAPGGNVEEARQALIPIDRDFRVPMKQVHDLFAGRGDADAVLEAARRNKDSSAALSDLERSHLCYAHLYLGLYFEALGEDAKSAEHIRKAAYEFPTDHYMGKTAQVHAKLRGIGPLAAGTE